MNNIPLKVTLISLSMLGLAACQSTNVPEYFPGYYQEAEYHSARYERPYYDYYGNYHAGYVQDSYVEPGRWHRAAVMSVDNVGKYVYVEPAEAERMAQMQTGEIAADRNDVNAVIR